MRRLAAAAADFLRRHAARLDAALGALVAALGVLSLWSTPALATFDHREPDAFGVGLTLLAGAAVAVRTRWPVPALLVACGASLIPLQLGYPQSVASFAPLLILYTVAARRPMSVSAPAAALVYLLVGLLLVAGPMPTTLADWVSNSFMIVAVWAVGRSVRSRRAESAGREERNRALFEAREARARATEVDERAAIAREMHDLVTHGITELTVQTSAARRLLRSDPDTAEQLLTDVERRGRDAIAEMRRVLDVLRPAEDTAALRPQPGLADLEALLDDARADGMEVQLLISGTPADVEQGVGLTAYRIVQEALRNIRQHAGRATARVTLDWRQGCLCLVVEDDGRGALSWFTDFPPDGHGLNSLRERVAAYGGSLRTGPRRGGGFTVTATLPTNTRSQS
ncbi:sensor histidine kinase [Blastococcus sp. VKM Ac-2987]|uniref:sensor histidine kinase n=1 Tax=Blastococcus sp. VKM Ac-2987 TaxID=3004141 RepID=UPI0022AB9C71|nr:sensor histidine kinase [Blastococcus sp. VKM Ac-2987]MCZ2860846.1 sensor histidine kinase [Blastococcus sp. VKM Ac-2987]